MSKNSKSAFLISFFERNIQKQQLRIEKRGRRMTLEQAINHLEEELKNKQDWSCVACKEEHEQLLEWLKELQAITQYAVASDTVNTESKVRKMLQELLDAPIYELSNGQTMECEEDKIKKECETTYLLLYKDRKELVKMFKEWCKENNADEYSQENVIAWMQMNRLIDTNKAKELLKEIKDE